MTFLRGNENHLSKKKKKLFDHDNNLIYVAPNNQYGALGLHA